MTARRVRRPDGSVRVYSARPRGGRFDLVERIQIIPAIRQRILEGRSNLAIAEELGIHDRTVARYRHAWNLPNYLEQAS